MSAEAMTDKINARFMRVSVNDTLKPEPEPARY
jgi:hypothetical protein